MAEKSRKLTAPVTQMCEMFLITQQRYQQLYDNGILPPPINAKCDVAESVKAYVQHLRAADPAKRADAALKEARHRKLEIQIARETRDLVEFSEVEADLAATLALAKTNVDGALREGMHNHLYLNGKMDRISFLELRDKLELAIDDGWNRTSKALRRVCARIKSGMDRGEQMTGDDVRTMLNEPDVEVDSDAE